MAWVNVFTAGDCLVQLFDAGVLIDPADYVARGISVTTLGGVVSVDTTSDTLQAVSIRVAPQFDVSGADVRAGSYAEDDTFGLNQVVLTGADSNDVIAFVDLVDTEGVYSPDPCEFVSPGSWSGIAVTVNRGV